MGASILHYSTNEIARADGEPSALSILYCVKSEISGKHGESQQISQRTKIPAESQILCAGEKWL